MELLLFVLIMALVGASALRWELTAPQLLPTGITAIR